MEDQTAPRWWDVPAAALLLVTILTAATRLVATEWTGDLQIVQNIAFLATISGLALGFSRFSPPVARLFAVAYGLFAVPWQLGRTMGPGIMWSERLASLSGRLQVIFEQLAAQEAVQDSLLFLVLMSVLFWVLGSYAGYSLVRHGNVWASILPTGLALFVIHSFDPLIPRRAWYLAVFIFFALVLVARVTFLHRYSRWRNSRTTLPPHLGLDFIRFALLATAFVVLFAWTAPALAETLPPAERIFQKVRQPWNEMRDRFDNAFASLRSTVGIVSDYYGSSVMLGRGNQLTDTQVFYVLPPEERKPVGTRYYWRARAYDTYRNGQWLSTEARSHDFNPQVDSIEPVDTEGRWTGTFEVIAASPISTLFSPSQPLWVSRPAEMEATEIGDELFDLSSFRATPVLRPGERYQVHASLTQATVAELRASGTEYPDWVQERYLQLPEEITPRTRDLAARITEGHETPYDKAMAITTYLRENIEYSETVTARPTDQEAVDWFLFDYRKGFCNYYATAEVVLLRSIGIPARWAVGYGEGEDLEDGTHIVRQRDAHAWPEVYFPGLGWVEFEPTASEPVLLRLPGGEGGATEGLERDIQGDPFEDLRSELEDLRAGQQRGQQEGAGNIALEDSSPGGVEIALWAGSLIAAAGLLWLAWRRRSRYNFAVIPVAVERTMVRIGLRPPKFIQRWSLWANLPPLARSYSEINSALARLGSRPPVTDTPAERAENLGRVLPEVKSPARNLVAEYEMATFSPGYEADLTAAKQDGSEIKVASFKAWFKRAFSRFQRKTPKERAAWWQQSSRSNGFKR